MTSPATNEPDWQFARHTHPIWDDYRYKILWGGRGGVKSWTAARYFLLSAYDRPRRILCGREVQKSIRESVHQLLSDQVELLGLGGFYEVLTTEIRGRNGSKFAFTGLSNLTADSIKSYEGYDGFWGEEARKFTRRSLDILFPTLREDGSEFVFTLNPELDTDEIWVRFIEDTPEDCVTIECSYHNNPWFPKVLERERQEFLRQVEMGKRTQADYEWIWEGKCKPAVDGAIYPDEVAAVMAENRLCPVPYDPTLLVHTVWDLGWNDKMAIGVVQTSPGSVRIIDYIEDSHRMYDSYIEELLSKPYAKKIKSIWLPHDGKARNPQTGKSPIELCTKLVENTNIEVPEDGIPNIGEKAGIEAARQMFPRVYFDKDKCTPLFNRLRRYARVISPTTLEPGKPKHDEHIHGADMFRYVAVVEKELTNEDDDFAPIEYSNAGIV